MAVAVLAQRARPAVVAERGVVKIGRLVRERFVEARHPDRADRDLLGIAQPDTHKGAGRVIGGVRGVVAITAPPDPKTTEQPTSPC